MTHHTYNRVTKAQQNIQNILKTINEWGSVPLFTRKHDDPDALIDIARRDAIASARLIKCMTAKKKIDEILNKENFCLYFNMQIDSCPCSSDDEDETNSDEEVSASPSMRSTKASSISVNEALIALLRKPVQIKFSKSEHQLKLYRPYEEYIDKLIGDALMDAITVRYVYFTTAN